MFEYRAIDDTYRNGIIELCAEQWGSAAVVSNGTVHSVENLPGYVALEKSKIAGFTTYSIENGECELVMLASFKENKGIGSMLTSRVILTAQEHGCRRVWLVTTNDNTRALRFYQKRGFDMAAFRRNAVEQARKLKPEIPLIGNDEIPIKHEIEFEIILTAKL
jgi:ribosomal protein S18 acetylase RimI-like enzyme